MLISCLICELVSQVVQKGRWALERLRAWHSCTEIRVCKHLYLEKYRILYCIHALKHFSISEYFLPFSPSLTRRSYLSLLKACQILLREVSGLIDAAWLLRRPSYSVFRAIILLPSFPWQMEDGLLAVFLSLVLSATVHAPKTNRTDALYPWDEGRVEGNESHRALRGFSDPGCSLPWRSHLRWGAVAEWIIDHKGLEEPVWSLSAGSTLLSNLLSDSLFNFLPDWPSLYQLLHDRDWGMRRRLYVGAAENTLWTFSRSVCIAEHVV